MNFTDRPNADRRLMQKMLEEQEQRRRRQVETVALREPTGPRPGQRPPTPTTPAAIAAMEAKEAERRASEAKFLPLYENGMNDPDIARAIDRSVSYVRTIRMRLGLPTNFDRAEFARQQHLAGKLSALFGAKTEEELNAKLEELRALHAKGLIDSAIAKRMGASQESVSSGRNRLGLPPNGDWGGRRKAVGQ